jgi:hypothetical protein
VGTEVSSLSDRIFIVTIFPLNLFSNNHERPSNCQPLYSLFVPIYNLPIRKIGEKKTFVPSPAHVGSEPDPNSQD